jgi:hypothetical protein
VAATGRTASAGRTKRKEIPTTMTRIFRFIDWNWASGW